jgi:hypothetical protein
MRAGLQARVAKTWTTGTLPRESTSGPAGWFRNTRENIVWISRRRLCRADAFRQMLARGQFSKTGNAPRYRARPGKRRNITGSDR